jgi:N-methylhydantoinase A
MAWQIGVDVGGTFTDLLALDPERGVFRVTKVLSTPEDQSIGFIAGLAELETDLAAVAALVHGTTVATNAVLERKGARCGLIATGGFRDVLELGRRTRPNPYGMTGSFEALIPRDLRVEVPERIDAAGRVLIPLDETAVRREVHRLRERGAEALVIHFIHAYANPAHEQRCAEIAREIWPNRFVTLGSDILREVREFERGSTAALNGYVQPIVSRYLGRLSQNLRSAGLSNELLVMQGNGGMMAASTAIDLAVHTVMSGPGRRSDRRGADRRAGRLSQSRRLRHGRDQLRCLSDLQQPGPCDPRDAAAAGPDRVDVRPAARATARHRRCPSPRSAPVRRRRSGP